MSARTPAAVEFPPYSGEALREKVQQECRGRSPFICFKNSQVNLAECLIVARELGVDFAVGEAGCGFYAKKSAVEDGFAERLRAKREGSAG